MQKAKLNKIKGIRIEKIAGKFQRWKLPKINFPQIANLREVHILLDQAFSKLGATTPEIATRMRASISSINSGLSPKSVLTESRPWPNLVSS